VFRRSGHKYRDRCYRYVLSCDVRQFFPSIDHAILRDVLSRKIHDPDVLWLVDKVLASGAGVLSEEYNMVYFPRDDLFAINRPRGLPIGNLTSQFWANCYLNPFDHYVKRELRCKGYIRYVDDFLLFGDNKRELIYWHNEIITRLSEFRLTLHENSAWPRPVCEGFPFLGFTVFPTHRRLKRCRGIAFSRRLRLMLDGFAHHAISFERLDACIKGWVNHVRYGNTWGLRNSLLNKTARDAMC